MTVAAPLRTRPLSPKLGVEVLDLDLASPVSEAAKQQIRDLWTTHGLVLFRGLGHTPEALLEISKWIGKLEIHPVKSNLNEAYPEILDISYRPPKTETELTAPIYDVNGERLCSWIPWHYDLVYMAAINHGGILRAIKVPPKGGTTGFIDRVAAYEALTPETKQRIDNLHVVYQLGVHMQTHKFIRGFAKDIVQIKRSSVSDRIDLMIGEGKYPAVVHPMVHVQKETGRKVLDISPTFAVGVLEMQNEQGDQLLMDVIDQVLAAKLDYHHAYENGDLVLFDNWRMLHQADGVPESHERLMQRTTIEGDPALGRKLAA